MAKEPIEKKCENAHCQSAELLATIRSVSIENRLPKNYTCPITGMEFVFVKGGKFNMKDLFDNGIDDEYPGDIIEADDFYMGIYPVTQEQWKKVMDSNPSYFKDNGDNCPVESVSCYDAHSFIKKLNSMTDGKYRLPYEDQWQYAATWTGEGKKHKRIGSDNKEEIRDYAWCSINSDNKTHPVGLKKPNALGLYDIIGNVWEWCMSFYVTDYDNKSYENNLSGYASGDRLLLGGSYLESLSYLWFTIVGDDAPDFRCSNVGFRLTRAL